MKGYLLLFFAISLCLANDSGYIVVPDVHVQLQDNSFVEFIKGFLEGINEKGDINKLMQCIKGGEEIVKKIMAALDILKKISLENLIKGITMLLEAMTELMNMLKPCMEGFDQLKKLMNAITHVDIKKIALRILTHPTEFLAAVMKGIECFGKKDMHCLGKAVGDLMRIMFLSRRTADPAYDFIKGFLEGIHETRPIEDLLKCLKNMDPVMEKIRKALEHFMKMTLSDLIQGFKLLVEALKDIEDMLKPCLENFQQIKKLMEAIAKADIMKIIFRILANPGAFIKDVQDCIEALKKLDFYSAGKDIGDILYRLFLNRLASVNPIQDFVDGFLKGIHEERSIDDLLKCMKNADQILEKIKAALALIKKFTLESLLQGLSMLFEAIFDLEEMLRPCLAEFTQFKKLLEAIMEADIDDIIMKIMQNPMQFIADVADCIDALEKGNYLRAGRDVGDILYRLFLVELKAPDIKVFDFVKGFLEGINEKGDINELLKCVKDLEHILNKILEAIQYIKKMDIGNLIKGITLLFEAITELLNVLKPCTEGFEQIKKLIKAMSHIDIMKIVFKILANPGPYIQDVTDAIDAFGKNDGFRAGKDIGDILYRLFLASFQENFSFEDFVKMMEGFLKGINQASNFKDVAECLKKVPLIVEMIIEVIDIVKNLDWTDLNKMLELVFKLIADYNQILVAIKDCSTAPEEIEKILEKIKNISIESIKAKILANAWHLIIAINGAVEDLKDAHFADFGFKVGDIFYVLIIEQR